MDEADTQEFSVSEGATLLDVIHMAARVRRGFPQSREPFWVLPAEEGTGYQRIDADYGIGDIVGVEVKVVGDFSMDQIHGVIDAYGGTSRNELVFEGSAGRKYGLVRDTRGITFPKGYAVEPAITAIFGSNPDAQVALKDAYRLVVDNHFLRHAIISSEGRGSTMSYDALEQKIALGRRPIPNGAVHPLTDVAVRVLSAHLQTRLGLPLPTDWKVEYTKRDPTYRPPVSVRS